MRRLGIAALAVLAGTATLAFRSATETAYTASDLMGAWTAVEWQNSEGETTEITNPNLTLFTEKHYAGMRIMGDGPREMLPEDPTDEQLLAAFRRFGGNAGTYEVSGTTLKTWTMIAHYPNAMADDEPNVTEIQMEGDTMVRTWTNEETGAQFVVTFKRVE